MIKKKCTECGTLHSVDHATDCTGCGEANESLVIACEKHSNLNLVSGSSCPVCEAEQKNEEADRLRNDLEEKISRQDRELARLTNIERTLNAEVDSLRGRPKTHFVIKFLDWLEGPSVNQSDWKSLLVGSVLASLVTFFCLNNFTFFGGLGGDWKYHISGWLTALTAGILSSQLLWRLNLSFISIRGAKLVISICWGTIMAIILNASWGILLIGSSPSIFSNAIVVAPIFWWAITMNGMFGDGRRYGWGRYFYYGAPYFPWGEIIGRTVTTGLRIQPLSRVRTLFCLGISSGLFIISLWLFIWGLPGMVDAANQKNAIGLSGAELRQRVRGINPRYRMHTSPGPSSLEIENFDSGEDED